MTDAVTLSPPRLSLGGRGSSIRLAFSARSFAYGVRNRLDTVTSRVGGVDTTLATYAYNANGERVSKATASETRRFVYDRHGHLIAESDQVGNPLTEYVYLNGQVVGFVKYEQAVPTDIVIDNDDSGTSDTGVWKLEVRSHQKYGPTYRISGTNATTYRWTTTLDEGSYEVYAWWVDHGTYNPAATYTINHDGANDQVVEDQTASGGQWVLLGTYTFSGNGSEYVEVSSLNAKTCADAVRFLKIGAGLTPTLYHVHTDHLGTPQVVTDSNAQIVWRWDSDPFGNGTPSEDPDGDMTNVTLNLRFPGQYFDAESGLSYNYFRDYDPNLGRYTTSDPIGLAGGMKRVPNLRLRGFWGQGLFANTSVTCGCRPTRA